MSEPAFLERHYSVNEAAAILNVHPETIRRLFRDNPGVLKLGHKDRRSKRGYVTLRIPESILKKKLAGLRKLAA